VFLIPAARGWNVVRAQKDGSWAVSSADTMEEAAPLLTSADDVVLGLPVNAILTQRLRLPPAEAADFPDMVRIQVEKALPYPPEEISTDFEVIEQTEEGSVVSVVAVHNEKLSEIAQPLLSRGIIPTQVTVYAAQRANTHASAGRAFLLYREEESLVCAISEEGKLGFTHSLNGAGEAQLHRDLPQVALSAELQGIDTSFGAVLLDESLHEMRDALQGIFVNRADYISVETPPAPSKLNLLPDAWRQQRLQIARQREWKKRALWAAAAYAAVLVAFTIYIFILRFEVGRLDRAIERDEPNTAFVKETEARWRALAPAIDPRFYPIEILLHLHSSLPSQEVQITTYNQSARQLSVDGEARNASLAYQFVEKLKSHPELQAWTFEMASPRILPNDHAQFRIEGRTK
jgi:type II secretory pathway component PulL